MPPLVAIAASAGGIEALRGFIATLPVDLPAAVLVVMHVSPAGPSVLPRILGRAGRLPARHPLDGEKVEHAVIYVAPPDRHMVIGEGAIYLLADARVNGHRPSADVLFDSVARACGPRCAGVVLSGTMDDGAAGLRAVRLVGGLTLVQDPEEAAFPGMPRAAIEESDPHLVGTVAVLADRLCEWLGDQAPPASAADAALAASTAQRLLDDDPPQVTALTCPECGGSLSLQDEYGIERFRCRVGHTYSADGLLLGKQRALESALWAAIVALDERADVSRRIVSRLELAGHKTQVGGHRRNMLAAERQAAFLRSVVRDLLQEGSVDDGSGDGASTAS
jgi:two-component system, chemotaxis family, protein-glutamate methylesterase/glutaminase